MSAFRLLSALTALCLTAATAHADRAAGFDDLLSMDLDQLLNLKVSSASGVPESARHAPAALIVITADDIRQRGYDSLVDVLLVDGVVDNELWSQATDLSRQYPLQMLERIEILYGPASAVYGANAFAGVIHLITRRADAPGGSGWTLRGGSHATRSVEGDWASSAGALKFRAGVRLFASDDPGLNDLQGRHGFVSADWLADRRVWGPVLDLQHDGRALGSYHDPADNRSLLLNLDYGAWQAGLLWWQATEGFGRQYAADHAQVNLPWQREHARLYLENQHRFHDRLTLTTRAAVRHSRETGEWAEAEPDWNPGQSAFSYVSYSRWNTRNHAWSLEQKLDLAAHGAWRWLGGWKVERRDLTKAYAICGYWEPASYCPDDLHPGLPGPAGYGPWVVHSSAPALPAAPDLPDAMPGDNRFQVTNRNAHLQGTWTHGPWRAGLGMLLDTHSLYGTHSTPRLSLGHDLSPVTTVKLLYGEAWQEPAAKQVYGGWNGRKANPDLQPESAANTELVLMHAVRGWLHEMSLYQARYGNAIREDAVNTSGRRVRGLEYRGRFERDWLARTWSGYLYYSLTDARDDEHYDPAAKRWVAGEADIGDIARHKLQLGLTAPLSADWRLSLRGRHMGSRTLYSRNPLRALGERLPAHTTADAHLEYRHRDWTTAFSVYNLGDTAYETPGIAAADAGTDTSQRATGYYNSVLPQDGRTVYLSLSYRR